MSPRAFVALVYALALGSPSARASHGERRGADDAALVAREAVFWKAVRAGAAPHDPRIPTAMAHTTWDGAAPLLDPTRPFVHVMTSKFSVDQGGQHALAWARLELFRTLCLPSLLTQTEPNFLYFIYADPALPAGVIAALRAHLAASPRFALVLTNWRVHELPNAWQVIPTRLPPENTAPHRNLHELN
jgi:hypothetical protein